LPATVVTCFLVIASPITTFLNAAFVSHKLSNQNIFGAAVILFGMVIFWQINSSRLAQRNNLALNNN
jgi:drug/metabolite transporter (DMT)-like permease